MTHNATLCNMRAHTHVRRYEAEACKALHEVLRDNGRLPRRCLALSRFYSESRFGWDGPCQKLTTLQV